MANWGEMNMQRIQQLLESLRSARQGSASRGAQMQQSIGGVGQAITGGFGKLSDILGARGAEKRGFAHEKEMEDKRALGVNYQQSVVGRQAATAATKERMSRESEGALERNKIPKMIRDLFPGASDEEIWARMLEYQRAGNAPREQDKDDFTAWLDSQWITYKLDLPQTMDPMTGMTTPDVSAVDWDKLKTQWMAGARALASEGTIAWGDAEIEQYVDAFIDARKKEATVVEPSPEISGDRASAVIDKITNLSELYARGRSAVSKEELSNRIKEFDEQTPEISLAQLVGYVDAKARPDLTPEQVVDILKKAVLLLQGKPVQGLRPSGITTPSTVSDQEAARRLREMQQQIGRAHV